MYSEQLLMQIRQRELMEKKIGIKISDAEVIFDLRTENSDRLLGEYFESSKDRPINKPQELSRVLSAMKKP